jgi:hypothetical protein
VVKDLMQQLQDCMWTIPIYERAKQNILNREDTCRMIYGESLFADRSDTVKLAFDTEKGSCCFIENGQTLVHGRGTYSDSNFMGIDTTILEETI